MKDPHRLGPGRDPHWSEVVIALSQEARAWFVRMTIATALFSGLTGDHADRAIEFLAKLGQ